MKIFEHVNLVTSFVKPKLVVVMLLSLFSVTVFTSQLANAAVYKKVDADGNVSFSDVPDKTAQLITVAPLTTVPAMSSELIANTLENDPKLASAARAESYTLTIVSPKSDQTFHSGVDAFSENVQVKPNLANGDRVITFIDGKSANGVFEQMERGQHRFEAKVVSASGRVLTSKSVSFYVQQPNVKQQARIGIKH